MMHTVTTIGGILLLAVMALGLGAALTLFLTLPHTVTIGEAWFVWHQGSLNLAQALVQRYVSPGLWDHVILPALLWPALPAAIALAVVAGALSAVLLIRRRP